MKIIWTKVTVFSQIVAIILFVAVFYFGFYLGHKVAIVKILGYPINVVTFSCADSKSIDAEFYKNFARIRTARLGELTLPQTISASGARYANTDESIVFWNKGNTAFITEGDPNSPTYKDCLIK